MKWSVCEDFLPLPLTDPYVDVTPYSQSFRVQFSFLLFFSFLSPSFSFSHGLIPSSIVSCFSALCTNCTAAVFLTHVMVWTGLLNQ